MDFFHDRYLSAFGVAKGARVYGSHSLEMHDSLLPVWSFYTAIVSLAFLQRGVFVVFMFTTVFMREAWASERDSHG
jgi:hypothetical protein